MYTKDCRRQDVPCPYHVNGLWVFNITRSSRLVSIFSDGMVPQQERCCTRFSSTNKYILAVFPNSDQQWSCFQCLLLHNYLCNTNLSPSTIENICILVQITFLENWKYAINFVPDLSPVIMIWKYILILYKYLYPVLLL